MNTSAYARKKPLAMPGAALAMLLLMFAAAMAGEELIPSYDMNWFTLDHGGGVSTSSGFDLHGTIGQLDATPELSGLSVAGTLTMSPGYWPGIEPEPACVGDVAPGSGDGVVNITDLLAIIAAWGTSNPQFDIAPVGNPDGIVNISDLLQVISSWGLCPV